MNEMRQVCNNARGGTERERQTDRQTETKREAGQRVREV